MRFLPEVAIAPWDIELQKAYECKRASRAVRALLQHTYNHPKILQQELQAIGQGFAKESHVHFNRYRAKRHMVMIRCGDIRFGKPR